MVFCEWREIGADVGEPISAIWMLMEFLKNALKATAIVLLVALSLAGFGCKADEPPPGVRSSLAEYDRLIVFTQQQKRFLLAAARSGLAGEELPAPDPLLAAIQGTGATIEVFLPPEKPVTRTVGGQPFFAAFSEAVGQVAADPRFQSDFRPQLARARIKVGVIDQLFRLPPGSYSRQRVLLRRWNMEIEPGVHGLAVWLDGKTAYLNPERVIYDGTGLKVGKGEGSRGRRTGWVLLLHQLGALAGENWGAEDAWTGGEVYGFSTVSFVEKADGSGGAVDTYRGKAPLPPLSRASLETALDANLDYLLRLVSQDGKLGYLYYPLKNEYADDYDMPRHTGYALRMIQAYNRFGERKLLDSARRVIDFNLRLAQTPTVAPGAVIVGAPDESSLGTNSLMAMIFSELPENLLTPREKKWREQFGNAVLFYRMPDAGLFYTTFAQAAAKKAPKRQAHYFPGIALLALVRLHERTGDAKWWDAAAEVSRGQEKLWLDAGHRAVGKFCWVGQAWARMARIETDPGRRERYRQLGFSHADAVIRHQWTPERPGFFADYAGAADNSQPPRTTPTSARAESLVENYRTAREAGEREAQIKYGIALLRSLHFVVENQYASDNSWYLPAPARARGGIRGGLITGEVRIDYNQHAVFAMLGALDVPDQLRGLGVTEW